MEPHNITYYFQKAGFKLAPIRPDKRGWVLAYEHVLLTLTDSEGDRPEHSRNPIRIKGYYCEPGDDEPLREIFCLKYKDLDEFREKYVPGETFVPLPKNSRRRKRERESANRGEVGGLLGDGDGGNHLEHGDG